MRPGEPDPRSRTTGRRVPRSLVAVGSAIVFSIYTAGYLRTEGSGPRFDLDAALRDLEASAAAMPVTTAVSTLVPEPTAEPTATPEPELTATPEPEPTSTAVAAVQGPPPTPRPTHVPPTPRPTAVPQPPAPPPLPPPVATGYRDGTFTATGTAGNHGTLSVSVVISGGKIVSAQVSAATIKYSSSDVDPLVAEAVRKNDVPAGNVSGATDSCNAYKEAVIKALAQARG